MKYWQTWGLAFVAVAGLVAAGCGGSDADTRPRQAVSGDVALDGQPLAAGEVMFDPKSRADGVGAQGHVVDGKFSISADQGPTPGNYIVRVYAGAAASTETAVKKKLGDTKRDIDGPVMKDPIPLRFNTNSTLGAEVKAGGPNAFKFELDSKPDPKPAKSAPGRKAR
jgi:hypothetical protein